MTALIALIRNLMSGHWHGTLIVKLYGGKIAHVEKQESMDITQFNQP